MNKLFLLSVLAASSILTISSDVSAEPISVEGILVVVSKDDFNGGQAQIVYLLEAGATTYQLEFLGAVPALINKKVRVSGDRNGKLIKVSNNASAVQAVD